jgi:hypothetical protein
MNPRVKKSLSIALRVGIALAGLGYVGWQLVWVDQVSLPAGFELGGRVITEQATTVTVTQRTETGLVIHLDNQTYTIPNQRITQDAGGAVFRPGIITTLQQAKILWLVAALISNGPMLMLQTVRWVILMRCRGLPAPAYRSFRVYMVGLFFNCFMPGMTGGDLMKAYYVARRSNKREAAVVSIVADRAVGMIAMVLLACVAAVIGLQSDVGGAELRAIAWIAGIVLAGMAVYFIPVLRHMLGLTWLLRRLPSGGIIERVKNAIGAYQYHKPSLFAALTVGVMVHLLIIGAAILSAYGVGMTTSPLRLLAVMPLVLMVGALPVSFMGLGVMEPMGIALLADGGATATVNQVVAMLVLIRVYQFIYAGLGAFYMLRGNLDLEQDPDEQAE